MSLDLKFYQHFFIIVIYVTFLKTGVSRKKHLYLSLGHYHQNILRKKFKSKVAIFLIIFLNNNFLEKKITWSILKDKGL